jgi:hypothetical protein
MGAGGEQDHDAARTPEVSRSGAKREHGRRGRERGQPIADFTAQHAVPSGRVMSAPDDDEDELVAVRSFPSEETRDPAACRFDVESM